MWYLHLLFSSHFKNEKMRLSQVVYTRVWELGWGVGGGVEWKVKMSNRIIWLGDELQKYVATGTIPYY